LLLVTARGSKNKCSSLKLDRNDLLTWFCQASEPQDAEKEAEETVFLPVEGPSFQALAAIADVVP